MSPRYEPTGVDEVRTRADIVEVVGEHVRLKRAARQFKGLCPFHQERTPSFTVNPDRGVWYCHGCGAGGNVFNFVMQIDGLSFHEAVETLGRRFGVELHEAAGSQRRESPKTRLLTVHEVAVELYCRSLEGRAGEPVRRYLEDRGLTREVRERYRLGFGGWERNGLVRELIRRGFTAEELTMAGIASGEGRSVRDTFFGRVLFPIFDAGDRAVGFGGRVLPEEFRRTGAPDGPKYLNSRETPLFKKSRILYGANWARGDVMRTRRLVVVEGYTDVIAMREAGVGETVATCGTSLTEQHMQEISRRFGDVRIVLCLDADAAGQAAMAKDRTEELAAAYSPGEALASGKWLPVGRGWLPEVHVARLPQGQDPADFAAASGGEAVAEVLAESMPLVEFLLRRAISGGVASTPEDRTRAVRKGAEVLAQVGDPLLRHEYALWLSDRTGVDPYEVSKAVEARAGQPDTQRRSTTMRPTAEQTAIASMPPPSGPQRVERDLLRAIVAEPGLLAGVGDAALDEDDFTLPVYRSLFRLLRAEWEETDGRIDAARLADRVQDEAFRRAVSELSVADPPDPAAGREMLVRLKGLTLERRIDSSKRGLAKLDADREAAAYDALFEELLVLEKRRRAMRETLVRLSAGDPLATAPAGEVGGDVEGR